MKLLGIFIIFLGVLSLLYKEEQTIYRRPPDPPNVLRFTKDNEIKKYKNIIIKRLQYSLYGGYTFLITVDQESTIFHTRENPGGDNFYKTIEFSGYKIKVIDAIHMDLVDGSFIDEIVLEITEKIDKNI